VKYGSTSAHRLTLVWPVIAGVTFERIDPKVDFGPQRLCGAPSMASENVSEPDHTNAVPDASVVEFAAAGDKAGQCCLGRVKGSPRAQGSRFGRGKIVKRSAEIGLDQRHDRHAAFARERSSHGDSNHGRGPRPRA